MRLDPKAYGLAIVEDSPRRIGCCGLFSECKALVDSLHLSIDYVEDGPYPVRDRAGSVAGYLVHDSRWWVVTLYKVTPGRKARLSV